MWFSRSRSKIDAAGYDRNENECLSSHNVLGVDVDHIPPSRRRIGRINENKPAWLLDLSPIAAAGKQIRPPE